MKVDCPDNPQHPDNPSIILSQGHERITHKDWQVLHHRLLSVAWFGLDELKGNIVHHKNRIPWDSRESNLELMTHLEHINEHGLSERSTDTSTTK